MDTNSVLSGRIDPKILEQYVATANSGKYSSWEEVNSKFPELNKIDPKILEQYVATVNSGKYESWDEINSKFPEFEFDSSSADTPKEEGKVVEKGEKAEVSGESGSPSASTDSSLESSPFNLKSFLEEKSRENLYNSMKNWSQEELRQAGFESFPETFEEFKSLRPTLEEKLESTPLWERQRVIQEHDTRVYEQQEGLYKMFFDAKEKLKYDIPEVHEALKERTKLSPEDKQKIKAEHDRINSGKLTFTESLKAVTLGFWDKYNVASLSLIPFFVEMTQVPFKGLSSMPTTMPKADLAQMEVEQKRRRAIDFMKSLPDEDREALQGFIKYHPLGANQEGVKLNAETEDLARQAVFVESKIVEKLESPALRELQKGFMQLSEGSSIEDYLESLPENIQIEILDSFLDLQDLIETHQDLQDIFNSNLDDLQSYEVEAEMANKIFGLGNQMAMAFTESVFRLYGGTIDTFLDPYIEITKPLGMDYLDYREEIINRSKGWNPALKYLDYMDKGRKTIEEKSLHRDYITNPLSLQGIAERLAILFSEQTPILASLATGGSLGLGMMGTSVYGEKVKEYAEDGDVSWRDRLAASMAAGGEVVSERITQGILNKANRAYTAARKEGRLNQIFSKEFAEQVVISSGSEGLSETMAVFAENYADLYITDTKIQSLEGRNIFTGMMDATIDGTIMGGIMRAAPIMYGAAVGEIFTPKNRMNKISELVGELLDIQKELDNNSLDMDVDTFDTLRDRYSELSREIRFEINKEVERVSKMSKIQAENLIEVGIKIREVEGRKKLISENTELSVEIRDRMEAAFDNKLAELNQRKRQIFDEIASNPETKATKDLLTRAKKIEQDYDLLPEDQKLQYEQRAAKEIQDGLDPETNWEITDEQIKGRAREIYEADLALEGQPIVEKTEGVQLEGAPAGTMVNVGMKKGKTNEDISQQEIVDALPEGVEVLDSGIKEVESEGGTERTLSMELSRPLTDTEMKAFLDATGQQAIPQMSDGVGTMYGTKDWGNFNPDYFSTPDGRMLNEMAKVVPSKVTPTKKIMGEEALQWAKDNLDRLVDAYIEQKGNILDPDAVRDSLNEIGYDGKNVPDYLDAGDFLTYQIFEKMLDAAEASGNKTITLLTGVGGAGKSKATSSMDMSSRGVVFDSAFNSFKSLSGVIETAMARGFQTEVIAVHNDPITAFKNVLGRGKATGRFMSLAYFLEAYRVNQGKIRAVRKAYPEVTVKAIDNSGNQSKPVTDKAAEKWNYNLINKQVEQLLEILNTEIDGLKQNEITSVTRRLQEVAGINGRVTKRMGEIISGITERISQDGRQRDGDVGRKVGEDKGKPVRLKKDPNEQNKKDTDTKGKESKGKDTSKSKPTGKNISKKMREAAKKLDALKINKDINDALSQLNSNVTGLFAVAWDGSIETIKKSMELTGDFMQALHDGLQYLRNTEWYENLSDKSKAKAERVLNQEAMDILGIDEQSRANFLTKVRMDTKNFVDWFTTTLIDKYDLLRRGVKQFRPDVVKRDDLNFSRAEIQMHGRAAAALDKLEKGVKKLVEAVSKEGFTIKQLSDYLYAKHAEERNKHVRENVDPENEFGSGRTDQWAKRILEETYTDKEVAALERLSEMVQEMVKENRDNMLKHGLISKEQHTKLSEYYKNYVPLQGFDSELIQMFPGMEGTNMAIVGDKIKESGGRSTAADNILTSVIRNYTETVIRGHKNQVLQKLYNLALEDKNQEFVKVYPKGKVPKTVISRHPVGVMVNGEQYYLVFANPEFGRIVKGAGIEKIDMITKFVGRFNRYLSQVLTSLDPEFVISNFARDIQTAVVNVLAEASIDPNFDGRSIAMDVVMDTAASIKAIYQFERHGKADTEFGKMYKEFIEDGGKTGWANQNTPAEINRKLENLHKLYSSKKLSPAGVKKGATNVLDFISDVNTAVENGVRLAAYMNARKIGMTRNQAAELAKELTVNFNRTGTAGSGINSLYLFFNASIQGVSRLGRAMTKLKSKTKPDGTERSTFERFNAGQKAAAGISLFGGLLTMLNQSMSEDDEDGVPFYDKIPDYEKERNLIVMNPANGQDYFKIPLPYGYNVFHNMGMIGAEIASGSRGVADGSLFLLESFIGSFVPISFSESESLPVRAMSGFTPTLFKPALHLAMNEDHFGSTIYNENMPFSTPIPDAYNSRRTTPQVFKEVAEFLNDATGGSQTESGTVDVSPESLYYVFKFLVGGTGRTVTNTAQSISTEVDNLRGIPTPREIRKYPFLRRLYAEPNPYVDQNIYFDNIRLLKQREATFQRYREERGLTPEEITEFNKVRSTLRTYEKVSKRLSKLRRRRDRAYEIEDPIESMVRVNEIEEIYFQNIKMANRKFNDVLGVDYD